MTSPLGTPWGFFFRRDTIALMGRPPRKLPESYRAAAILYSLSGIIFIVVAAVSGKVAIFLPVGIALFVLSMVFRQHSRKLTNGEREDSSE